MNLKSLDVYEFARNKLKLTKDYFKSESFEEEIDYLILNLQMFDLDLEVPAMGRFNRNQRINCKLRLLQRTFKRLNLNYAPYGVVVGSLFGPKGTAMGSLLGTYIFLGCLSASVWRGFSKDVTEGLVAF